MSTQKPSLLRNAGRRAIIETLGKSSFSRHNFVVAFDDLKDRATLAQVSCAASREFFFKILKSPGYPSEPRYCTMECPGEELSEPMRYDRKGFDECVAALESWVKRISEDARQSSPLADEFQTLRKSLLEELARHTSDPQAHPAPAQAGDLQAGLEELARRCDKLDKICAAQAAQLDQLKTRLADPKSESNGPKAESNGASDNGWFKPTGTKVVA